MAQFDPESMGGVVINADALSIACLLTHTPTHTLKTKQVRNLVAENMIAKLRVRCTNSQLPSSSAVANPSEVRICV